MILLVDIGNTCLKWATVHDQFVGKQESIVHRDQDFFALLSQIWSAKQEIQAVWVANVAGDHISALLIQWVEQQWQITPQFAHSVAFACGVTNAYQHPEQLGIDRWLALVGAYHLCHKNVCIVDCGTAITVDVLLASGIHLGGLIAPGMVTMQKALLTETSALTQLIKVEEEATQFSLCAHNTTQGILFGVHYMTIGLLTYLSSEIEKKYDQTFTFIMTGGGAFALLPYLPTTYQYIPDLVLQGLKVVADKPS